MRLHQIAFGLIVSFLAFCHQPKVEAQFFQQYQPIAYRPPQQQQYYAQPAAAGGIRSVPRQGSVSRANSNAYERTTDYGNVELTQGVVNSRAVTKSNGGARNGGTTSVAKSNSLTREADIGGLDIGNTFTRTQTRTNGAVSQGISNNFHVGNLGLGASLSQDNLRNGFGLQRGPNGDVSLGLGLLNLDLSRNAQQQQQALTQAQVNAQGKNARVRSNSNAQTQTQQYGGVGVTETVSRSNAVGRTRNGQTSANTGGLATNQYVQQQPVYYPRTRRAPAAGQTFAYRPIAYRPVQPINYASPVRQLSRPKRRAHFIPFRYPEVNTPHIRERRQFFGGFQQQRPGFGFQQQQRPGFGFQQQERPGFGFGFQQQKQPNLNYNQQAGANTHANNERNQNGFFQDNGASSIGSNLAEDGSRGQVSSANVAQMNAITKDGSTNTNNAQSQSLNFDPNQQQASAANAGTLHEQTLNSERIKATGGSQVTNNNQFGTSTNIANTNSEVYRNGNEQGAKTDASSQSIFQGANGQNAAALTGSQTNSVRGPNGQVTNSASSNASATSQGGKGANASASSSASSGANGGSSFTNTNAAAGGGGRRNSGALGNFAGQQGFANSRG